MPMWSWPSRRALFHGTLDDPPRAPRASGHVTADGAARSTALDGPRPAGPSPKRARTPRPGRPRLADEPQQEGLRADGGGGGAWPPAGNG